MCSLNVLRPEGAEGHEASQSLLKAFYKKNAEG